VPQTVQVHLLPSLVAPDALANGTVVVIDVLRATTTIVYALAHRAREVVPCMEVEEARQTAALIGASAVLGGERGGVLIEGFDLGNSPDEYTADRVAGKSVVFTTTNGTQAIRCCHQAGRVLIGAFVNFSALCDAVTEATDLHLLCAGTGSDVTREDTMLAGAIVDDAFRRNAETRLNDQAEIAADTWRAAENAITGRRLLADSLRRSQGGRNILAVGLERDIDLAAEIDRFTIVPELDRQTGRIVVPQ